MTNEKRLIDAHKLDDLLSVRKNLLEYIFGDEEQRTPKEWARLNELDNCIAAVGLAAAVDAVEVVHGRWEQHGYKWKCSRCGVLMDIDGTPEENLLYYCPNCGAKMDGEEN